MTDDLLLALHFLAVSLGRHTGGKWEIDLSSFFRQEVYSAENPSPKHSAIVGKEAEAEAAINWVEAEANDYETVEAEAEAEAVDI